MRYFIERNGEVLFEIPWFKDAAKEFVKLLDSSKHGDYVEMYYVDKEKGKRIIRRVLV